MRLGADQRPWQEAPTAAALADGEFAPTQKLKVAGAVIPDHAGRC
jgi:hypothetical protein